MMGCRKIRGLMAASLYEALDANEQSILDEHLARCGACQSQAEQLRGLRDRVPADPVPFGGDLLPVLRQRLAEEAPVSRAWRRWAVPMAACALVLVTAVFFRPSSTLTPTEPIVASALESSITNADALLSKRDYTGALRVLQDALKSCPEDKKAGEAQLRLADIEFSELQRYAEAYTGYETLRVKYPEVWKAAPALVKDRFDLLSEARAKGFEPLYALNAARNTTGDSFRELEKVVAHYPGTMVAGLAVTAMRETVGSERGESGVMQAAALETVRECCTDPIAVAQVNLALGDMYWRELHDRQRAREVYGKAAQSEHAGLAGMALLALAELGQE